jgi:multiple sugar transport system permease protein/raffinose/stachyose/melibiose transport system permease protein
MKHNAKLTNILSPYLLILPAFIVFALFAVIPLLQNVGYSFTNWDGISPKVDFIGFTNFINMLTSPAFYNALIITLEFTIVTIVFQQLIAIFIAVMVQKNSAVNSFMRSVFFIPSLLSTVAVGLIFSYIFNVNLGVFNLLCAKLGLTWLASIDWLGNAHTAIFMCAFVAIWQYAGYSMVIYIGQLKSISPEYYESARIDGATAWKQFSHITLPLLAPALTVNTLVTLIGGLKQFDIPYVLTNGGPGNASQTITMLIFSDATFGNKAGYCAAESVILMLFIFAISVLQTRYFTAREVEM